MNNYCTDLNVKLTPLLRDVSFYGTAPHSRIPNNELHPELHNFFTERNLTIMLAELFYNDPKRVSQIHVDALGGDYSKVNFVWGGEKSIMCWYTIKDGVTNSINTTSIATRSVNFNNSEVSIAHKQSVKFPSIVQVGIPHNIFNPLSPRWCLSIVPIKENGKRLSMSETIEIFKDLISQ